MKMVVHEDVSVNTRGKEVWQLAEQFQKTIAIGIAAKNVLTIVAAGRDVITSSYPLNP